MSTRRFLPGEIAWTDLTIKDAGPVRDFYRHVVVGKSRMFPWGDTTISGWYHRADRKW